MTELMRLIPSDVGRSIEDIASKMSSGGLLQDAARVLEQLTPVETEIQTEQGRWYWRRTLPYRTEDSRIDGVVITFIETTEHKLAESRQRFLVEFYDAIRTLQEPEEIMASAARLSGQYFNVSRCAYGVLDELQTQVSVKGDYGDEVASLAGAYSLQNWDPDSIKELKRDRPLIITNVHTGSGAPPWAGIEARAVLMVPLVKAERSVALFTLSHRQPRQWSAEEMALAKQVAERTWLAVEKARADKALRLSEERFRIALKNSPITVFNQDQQLRYTWVHNPAGLSAPQLLGKRDADVLERPEDASALEALKQRVLETGQSEHQTVAVWIHGEQRWYDMAIEPQRGGESGQTVGLIGAAIDLTARLRLETQLRQQAEQLAAADRQKNTFLAMLGHELRNPLAPIRNAVYTLKTQQAQGKLENSTLSWGIDLIDRQVNQMVHLVNDLLEVAGITQDRIELKKERVMLADIICQAEEMVKPLIDERQQVLTVSLPLEDMYVEADPKRLVQVVTNLLNNAAKYSEEKGRIWLELRADNDNAIIQVRDEGRGIAAETLPQVFDLFVQAECEVNRSRGGLGLGLTLVRKLAEMHGGEVQAASRGLGQGSEFTVRLPLLPREQWPVVPGAVLDSKNHTPARRVLVVEDNRDVADSLSLLLKTLGHRVATVPHGKAALAMVQDFQPEVVFLDIGLPEMDGYEVARRLRKLYPPEQMMLIALTGYGQTDDITRAHKAGFDRHLLKPVSQETLEALLASFKPSNPV